MIKLFSNFICKNKIKIIIVSLLLLIPSIIGYINTKINYDVLTYLPKDNDTVKGQNILRDEYKVGAFSMIIIDNKNPKKTLEIENKIRKVKSVNKVLSVDDISGLSIPIEMFNNEILDKVQKDNNTLMLITFDETTSNDLTLNAISEIRKILDGYSKVGGMSSLVLDTMELSNKESIIYIIIAIVLCLLVLELSLDSYIVPFLLLFNIGISIIYNLGSNIIFGDISYITKAISAVLQLGVTTDFSIFLYHKYEYYKTKYSNIEDAMREAIKDTITSVFGSAVTTIAGFLALCAMNLTLGKDIGLVMAKGVVFGVLTVITFFPALLLACNNLLTKTKHKKILPEFKHIKNFVLKFYKPIFIVFLILLIPAIIGNSKLKVYYNLDKSMPQTLDSIVANKELEEKFNVVSPQIIILDKNIKPDKVSELISRLKELDGISLVLGTSEISKFGVPLDMINEEIASLVYNDKYQLIIVNSLYPNASPELTKQIEKINPLIKEYDKNAILAGEGALNNDLILISDEDFKNVNYLSIAVILILMFIVLKSASLPILLIFTIEFAIFSNTSISYYGGTVVPFIASIVIGTIQLGATIDYAILMTTKYLEQRKLGKDKFISARITLDSSVTSIFVSAMCFFASTIGVYIFTDLELIGSICLLISRGAIISMFVVILILPSLLIIFDKLIIKTTVGFRKKEKKMKKRLAMILIMFTILLPINIKGVVKDETVYTSLYSNGNVKKTVVSTHLSGLNNGEYEDKTILKEIENTSGSELFNQYGNKLVWSANGSDIFYKGIASKGIPINTNIKYYLDGIEYTSKELNGKSGHIKIEITFKNNLKNNVKINGKKNTVYTPFVVVTLVNMERDNNTNVKVTNGKVIDNGLNYSIVALTSPGLYESLKVDSLKGYDKVIIEYDTTNYKFNTIYNATTSELFDSLDFGEINSAYKNVSKLSSAYKQILNGSKTIKTGISDLNKNYKEFDNGISELNKGTNELEKNYKKFNDGINEYNDTIQKFNKYLPYIQKLDETISNLSEQSETIANKSNEITTIINNSIDSIDSHIDELEKIKDQIQDENVKQLLENEINKLKNNQYIDKLNEIKTGVNAVNNKIQTLNDKSDEIASTAKKIDEGAHKLFSSLDLLAKSSDQIYDGIKQVDNAVTTLSSYSKQFNTGISKLNNGYNTFDNGLNKFDKEGISKINSLVNSKLKPMTQKVEKMINLGNNYGSFAGKTNKTESKTKFIMIVSE